MNVNNEILEIFKEFKIRSDDGICYLVSLFHGYNPTYIPDDLKKKVNATNIITSKNNILHWNIPLYEEQMTAFEWVDKEYVYLFESANSDKRGNARESIRRMKKFFANNPDIRKDEVIGATKMYIRNTDVRYIRLSHYFIEKGAGATKTNDILEWVDKYRLSKDVSKGRRSYTNTLQ